MENIENVETTNDEMTEKETMSAIFDIAKKTEPKKTRKQIMNDITKETIKERLKNAREKKKNMAERLNELEKLLLEKDKLLNSRNEDKKEEPKEEQKEEHKEEKSNKQETTPINKIDELIEIEKPKEEIKQVEISKPIEHKPIISLLEKRRQERYNLLFNY